MGIKFSQLPIASSVASDDYLAVLDTSEEELKRTTINHASATDAFGLGTANAYGHNKIIDDLSKTSFANGEALAAHQGNVLANDLGYAEFNDTASRYHAIGEYFMFKGQFVKCTSAISTGNTIIVGTNVSVTDVGFILSQLNSNLSTSIQNFAPLYSTSARYSVGDLVTYIDAQGFGKLYKCIVSVTSPEAFNINKWDDVTTSEVYARKKQIIATTDAEGGVTTWVSICQFISSITFDKNKMYWLQEEYSDGTIRTFIMQEITANNKPVFTRIDFAAAYVALWNIDSTTVRNCKLETTGTTILDRSADVISSLDTSWSIIEQ